MLQSHVVEVSGIFAGVAISVEPGFRFRAVHLAAGELDGSMWPSLDDLRQAARHLFTTARLPHARNMPEAGVSPGITRGWRA